MVERVGHHTARYGLVVVIAWIGAMKFTTYEANAISGFVENSPFMSWAYSLLSVKNFSVVLGIVELAIAVMIALGPKWKRLGVLGAALAAGMFATTLSFMISTPGVFEASLDGFPALSAMPGQFLVKDLALIGVSIWLLGVSLSHISQKQTSSR